MSSIVELMCQLSSIAFLRHLISTHVLSSSGFWDFGKKTIGDPQGDGVVTSMTWDSSDALARVQICFVTGREFNGVFVELMDLTICCKITLL